MGDIAGRTVSAVDPRTDSVAQTIALDYRPGAIAVGMGGEPASGSLTTVESSTGQIEKSVRVGDAQPS